jgi:hypothetical protein
VQLAAKAPDLKELWAALRAATPAAATVAMTTAKQAVRVEDGVWRD